MMESLIKRNKKSNQGDFCERAESDESLRVTDYESKLDTSNPHPGFQGEDCVHQYIFPRVQVFSSLFSVPKPCSESALN